MDSSSIAAIPVDDRVRFDGGGFGFRPLESMLLSGTRTSILIGHRSI
ncbi:hypothetical protein [Methylobacterium nigriterrae]